MHTGALSGMMTLRNEKAESPSEATRKGTDKILHTHRTNSNNTGSLKRQHEADGSKSQREG